jgi:hypothetical protein
MVEPSGKVRVEADKVQSTKKTHKKNMQLRVLALGTQVVRQGSGREKKPPQRLHRNTLFKSPPIETLTIRKFFFSRVRSHSLHGPAAHAQRLTS